jgi:hypothetical protein
MIYITPHVVHVCVSKWREWHSILLIILTVIHWHLTVIGCLKCHIITYLAYTSMRLSSYLWDLIVFRNNVAWFGIWCNNVILYLRFYYSEVYSIQHHVIKFGSDLRQVGGFLLVLRFFSTNKTDRHDITTHNFSGDRHWMYM